MPVVQCSHPLITHLVSRLRDISLSPLEVRQTIGDIGRFLFFEAMVDAKIATKNIHTWKETLEVPVLSESEYVIIPILRAGLPMVEEILPLMPYASCGFMAMKRDETTLESRLYYDRLPDLTGKYVVICDTMLATGGSLDDALGALKAKGADDIIALTIVGTKLGVERITKAHPDVKMYIAQIDASIEDGYIYPGIGDAGDRAYNC